MCREHSVILSLTIDDRVIDLIIEAKARVRILLLSVSSNFDNSSIDARETNALRTKDCDLIEILI